MFIWSRAPIFGKLRRRPKQCHGCTGHGCPRAGGTFQIFYQVPAEMVAWTACWKLCAIGPWHSLMLFFLCNLIFPIVACRRLFGCVNFFLSPTGLCCIYQVQEGGGSTQPSSPFRKCHSFVRHCQNQFFKKLGKDVPRFFSRTPPSPSNLTPHLSRFQGIPANYAVCQLNHTSPPPPEAGPARVPSLSGRTSANCPSSNIGASPNAGPLMCVWILRTPTGRYGFPKVCFVGNKLSNLYLQFYEVLHLYHVPKKSKYFFE